MGGGREKFKILMSSLVHTSVLMYRATEYSTLVQWPLFSLLKINRNYTTGGHVQWNEENSLQIFATSLMTIIMIFRVLLLTFARISHPPIFRQRIRNGNGDGNVRHACERVCMCACVLRTRMQANDPMCPVSMYCMLASTVSSARAR